MPTRNLTYTMTRLDAKDFQLEALREVLGEDPSTQVYQVTIQKEETGSEASFQFPSRVKFIYWAARSEGQIVYPPIQGWGDTPTAAFEHALITMTRDPSDRAKPGPPRKNFPK